MLADQTYTVVQHAGHGLNVLPMSAYRSVLDSVTKLKGVSSKPTVHLLDGAEIRRILAVQRAEVADELPIGQMNGARPRQGQSVRRNNNRRVEVLKIVARSNSGMTRDQVGEMGGMKRSTVYNALLRLLKLGLIVNVEGSFPKRVMITAAGRGLI
jgi:hypothetical protein